MRSFVSRFVSEKVPFDLCTPHFALALVFVSFCLFSFFLASIRAQFFFNLHFNYCNAWVELVAVFLSIWLLPYNWTYYYNREVLCTRSVLDVFLSLPLFLDLVVESMPLVIIVIERQCDKMFSFARYHFCYDTNEERKRNAYWKLRTLNWSLYHRAYCVEKILLRILTLCVASYTSHRSAWNVNSKMLRFFLVFRKMNALDGSIT